jgi:signal transduction histidine kinase
MMRATHTDVYINSRGRRLERMSLAQRKALRRQYKAKIPVWRQPLVGYLASVPLVALAILTTSILRGALGDFHFPSALLILAVLIVATVWGVGPSLFTLLLSAVLLEYNFTLPPNQFLIRNWVDGVQLLPFLVSGLIVAIITAQRERARLKTLMAEQELQEYARELEEINTRLEDASQMKDRFLSIASHELKTPITTIRGQAQLALRRLSKLKSLPDDTEGVQSSLERINDQTSRLTSLIDELLDVSSIRNGKAELRKRRTDLRDICREVVEDQRLLTDRSILLDMPSEPVKLSIDADRISQVLVNLVSNAVKYSPEESAVEVCVQQESEGVLIQVRDHGKGIPVDQQAQIFEIFYRTPDAEASTKQGLGLGLAISREIVERHEGQIWCESQPGKGSSFFVKLPLR